MSAWEEILATEITSEDLAFVRNGDVPEINIGKLPEDFEKAKDKDAKLREIYDGTRPFTSGSERDAALFYQLLVEYDDRWTDEMKNAIVASCPHGGHQRTNVQYLNRTLNNMKEFIQKQARESLHTTKQGGPIRKADSHGLTFIAERPRLADGGVKATISVERDGKILHKDVVALYHNGSRISFGNVVAGLASGATAEEVSRFLLEWEREIGAALFLDRSLMNPKQDLIVLSVEEREKATLLARRPDLLDELLKTSRKLGRVGDENNLKIIYLAACSRKRRNPISLYVRGVTAGGKTTLVEAAMLFIPKEDIVRGHRITRAALDHLEPDALKGKVFLVFEAVGGTSAEYSLRLLMTGEGLRLFTTQKDPDTGAFSTVEKEVEGPLSVITTTVDEELDAQNLSRVMVLYVDESQPQTRRIQEVQRQRYTPEGTCGEDKKEELLKPWRDLQVILEPLRVVIPYVEAIEFPVVDTRFRRYFQQFLTLIETLAHLYQFQRTIKTIGEERVILASFDDYRMAYDLSSAVFAEMSSELPKSARELLAKIVDMTVARGNAQSVKPKDVTFTRLDVATFAVWPKYKVDRAIKPLEKGDYLVMDGNSKRGTAFVYKCAVEVAEVAPTPKGILPVDQLEEKVKQDPSYWKEGA